jgi:uncharacterized protein
MIDHDNYPAGYTQGWLAKVNSIALVGASSNPARPSFGVMRYLLEKGYFVTPVNPGQAGGDILGQTVAESLDELAGPVDMIDVFRNSAAIPVLTEEILALDWKPKLVWMQLGVRDDDSAARLEAAGIAVIMNRCPAIELRQ